MSPIHDLAESNPVGAVYTYRISDELESKTWVFRSSGALPLHVTVEAIQRLATIARRKYSWWWVVGDRQGVSVDFAHAAQTASRWARTHGGSIFLGEIVHDEDLETEPRLPAEGKDLSNG